MKNIDEWVEWMTRNPELAEKYYPEIMQGLTEQIKSSEPFLTALIIQKLPDHFPNWKTEAEKYLCIKRKKMIQGYIDLIKTVLIEYEYPSEIEQKAVESVRAELTEQLEYWNNELKALPPQPIDEQKPIKYGAKEYALTYIFDLYAIGQQVPINRIEGSFDAKKIKQDASKFPMYDKAPDTFYRAVKSVLKYDLNKPTDLQNISKDWLNAVRNLSTNWVITEQYLKDKNLIGE